MRGDGGELVRGRFRCGGEANLDQVSRHPWSQRTDPDPDADGTVGYVDRLRRSAKHDDMATVGRPGCESRGRPIGRNGEEVNAAGERMRSDRSREGKGRGSIWDRVWERSCWVCCGAERGEEGGVGNANNVVVMDLVGVEGVGGVGRREGDVREGI